MYSWHYTGWVGSTGQGLLVDYTRTRCCCCHSNAFTLPMKTLAAFHPRSLGIRPRGASSTITAAATLITASGGFGNVFNSVRFTCKKQRRKKRDLSWTANWVSVTLSTIKFRCANIYTGWAVIYEARDKIFPTNLPAITFLNSKISHFET